MGHLLSFLLYFLPYILEYCGILKAKMKRERIPAAPFRNWEMKFDFMVYGAYPIIE